MKKRTIRWYKALRVALACALVSTMGICPAWADTSDEEVDAEPVVEPEGNYREDSVIVTINGKAAARSAQGYNALVAEESVDSIELLSVPEDGGDAVARVMLPEDVTVGEAIADLEDAPGVLSVQPNYIYYLIDDTVATEEEIEASLEALATEVTDDVVAAEEIGFQVDDPFANNYVDNVYTPNQWYLQSINAKEAWLDTRTNSNVTVAVLDTGINFEHDDLKNVIDRDHAYWFNYDDYGDVIEGRYFESEEEDVYAHGTHVAGIIAAEANNGFQFAGVSYNASVLPIKVFYDYYDYLQGWTCATDDGLLLAAYQYLFDVIDAGNDDIRVVNMSLGGDSKDAAFEAIIDEAYNDYGILSVCAAGNDGSTSWSYPSDYENCTSVVSVNSADRISTWSNYGIQRDIAAPGEAIWSAYIGSDSAKECFDGTSMAAPVVSGVAALMFAKDPSITPREVQEILYDTAIDLGPVGKDEYFANGKVDAAAALAAVDTTYKMSAADSTYTGSFVSGGIEVRTKDGYLLSEGTDYTVTYSTTSGVPVSQPVDVGSYKAHVVGLGYFDDLDRTIGFRIIAKSVANADVTVADIVDQEYTGFGITPEPAIYADGRRLDPATDYVVGYGENTAVGKGVMTITGTGNYTGRREVEFNIVPRMLTGNSVAISPVGVMMYNGQAQTPGICLQLYGRMLQPEVDYTVTYTSNVNAGTGRCVVTGLGNYRGSVGVPFVIMQRPLTSEGITVDVVPDQTLTGNRATPKIVVRDGELGTVLTEGVDFRTTYLNNNEIGMATVLIWGIGNYSHIQQVDFNITGGVGYIPPATGLPSVGDPGTSGGSTAVPGNGEATGEGTATPPAENVEGDQSAPSDEVDIPDDANPLAPGVMFSDVNIGTNGLDGDWFVADGSLKYVVSNGIMTGVSSTEFAPLNNLTRAEAATILYRCAKTAEGSGTGLLSRELAAIDLQANRLTDVESGSYYEAPVAWCVANGVVTGYINDDGTAEFRPWNCITRGELATMISRFCTEYLGGEMTAGDITTFYDYILVPSWARTGMSYCNGRGIITGYADSNLLGPADNATRAQMAKMVRVMLSDE